MIPRDPAQDGPVPEPNGLLAAEGAADSTNGASPHDLGEPSLPADPTGAMAAGVAADSPIAELTDAAGDAHDAPGAADDAETPDVDAAAVGSSQLPDPPVESWLASTEGDVPLVPPTWLASTEPGTVPAFVDDPYARAARAGTFVPFAAQGHEATQAYVLDVEPVGTAGTAEAAEPDRRRGFPLRRLVLAFAAGLLLAATVAAGALYAYDQQFADKILPGVQVGSVDVSGLDRATARERLAQEYSSFGEGRVVITLGQATTVVPYTDLHRRADVDSLVDQAFAIGRSSSPLDRILQELRTVSRGVSIETAVTLDSSVLTDRVAQIIAAAQSSAVDATVAATPTGFTTTPAQVGESVDAGTQTEDAVAQLSQLDAPAEIRIDLVAKPMLPAVTDEAATEARSQAERMAQDVMLADGKDRWIISADTVRSWISFEMFDGKPHPKVDVKAVLAAIKPLAAAVEREPVDATLFVKKDGKTFGTTPSVDGRALNASKTTTVVVNVVRARAKVAALPGALIKPVLTVTHPAFTTAEAKAAAPKLVEISRWTTPYQPSERNGFGINIRLPTKKIDTYVVAPRARFSFWAAVGPVTRDLGYTDGGAIIDGHTQPQGALAGGICSCSTTLFNAAVRAGFEINERSNHFYYISRYPLGLDATVLKSGGSEEDMSWTNDTDNPVVIRGINGPASVTFVLYSVPTGRTVTFTKPIVKNYRPAHTETVYTDSLPAGTRKQIEWQVDGQDVWVTRVVKDASGTIVHKETYYSHYSEVTGVIQVGGKDPKTNPAPTPKPTPTPTPTPAVSPTPSPTPSPSP